MKFFTDSRYSTVVILASVALAFTSSFNQSSIVLVLNWLTLAYFALEAFFKVKQSTWHGYIKLFGNKFDFSVLLLSCLFLISPTVEVGSVVYLRMFRIMSLVKVIRLMPDTRHILKGLIRALKASKAILILLAIQLVFFSLLGFTLFSDYLPEFFGNPLTAMNTIFTIFTIENWGAVPEAAKELNQEYVYYAVNGFVISVLVIGGFISLSLANAIFVDEMASDNNDELNEKVDQLSKENQEMKQLLVSLKASIEENKTD